MVSALALLALAGSARADGSPAVKQAEALIAEQENDPGKALTLLREAATAAPGDLDIAFDRARIALEHASLAQPDDFDAYLKLEPVTADHRVLRAYILASRGHTDEARIEAASAVAAAPGNTEAQGLVEALTPSPQGPAGAQQRDIAGRVRLFGQYDTNVSVLPDRIATSDVSVPSGSVSSSDLQRAAAAIGVEGDVLWVPMRGLTELSIVGAMSFLGHVSGRDDETVAGNTKQGSKTYDFGTFDLKARLAFPRERWNSTIELYGSTVYIDDYATRYLTEGTLLGSTNVAVDPAKSFRIGAYGLGGLRSFGEGFSVRDGTRTEGGLTFDYTTRHAGVGLRGSFQAELTDDKRFTEKGPQGMLYGRASFGRLDALAAFTYQHRAYDTVANAVDPTAPALERTDNRFGPLVQLNYALNDMLSVIGSYQYMGNASTVSGYTTDFDYSRHLATLGLEARL